MALLLHHHKTKLNTFTITNPSLLHRLFSTVGDGVDTPPKTPHSDPISKTSKKHSNNKRPPPSIIIIITTTATEKSKDHAIFTQRNPTQPLRVPPPHLHTSSAIVRSDFARGVGRVEEAETREKDWFWIKELSERLMRLREMEEKESKSNIKGVGVSFTDLKDSLIKMEEADKDKAKKISSRYVNCSASQ
ncbi:hypothetical protein RIF29_28578 [Crotalaria pallida]|uniref:Uncharacterized protein n=1 Tax=Crotalaria pallida TaxID=3830 RepID=A0AAN9HVH0_CROPI